MISTAQTANRDSENMNEVLSWVMHGYDNPNTR